jgi:hypothetical protein
VFAPAKLTPKQQYAEVEKLRKAPPLAAKTEMEDWEWNIESTH